MNQTTLFADPPTPDATEARKREAFARTHAKRKQKTSREAAERIAPKALSNVEHVAELVNYWPGLTSAELAVKSKDLAAKFGIGGGPLDRVEMARRCPDAASKEHGHLIRQGPARKCRVGRGAALTWWPASFTDSDIEQEMSNG